MAGEAGVESVAGAMNPFASIHGRLRAAFDRRNPSSFVLSPSSFGFVRRLAADESGVALVFVIAIFLFLFVLILSVYSVGENIRRKEELQNACDAAAYSAAVVQADGLSRMAVINRAMAWTHIQTTKMQMDYITYKWLKRVRDCFAEDMGNIRETGMGEFRKPEMGYHHLSEEFRSYEYHGKWLNIHFNCHDDVHDHANDPRARYIGLGPNTEGGPIGLGPAPVFSLDGVPGKHWIRINGFSAKKRRLQYSLGDLDYYEGDSCKASRLLLHLEQKFGFDALTLRSRIQSGKNIVNACGGMLPYVNDKMREAIQVAAKATLYANLPRKSNGAIDETLLKDYVYAIVPGAMPSEKCNPYDDIQQPSYYDPLYNCEEDEIRFLAMANGIPKDSDNIKLKDFFTSSTQGGLLAAGLDQWFIRCYPDEAWKSGLVGVYRNFAPAPKGIVRAYKNANYAEGRTGDGTLRGNYCLDGDGVKKPKKPSDIDSIWGWSLTHCPDWQHNPWWLEPYYHVMWLIEHFRVQSRESQFKNYLKNSLWRQVPYEMFFRFATNPDPSCINFRNRFVDQCANVNDSWGLYAEYEWAAAYWFCCWIELMPCRVPGVTLPVTETLSSASLRHLPICIHIPLPSAVFGGRNHRHYGNSDEPQGIADAQEKESRDKDRELGNLRLRGWSRNDYHRTFIGADGEEPYECIFHGGDGRGANMGAKGYVRIYGDDKEIFDACYVGAKAKPWVLNERFFNGGGTILVGVARRQRNVFFWITGDDGRGASDEGIYEAFTPDKKGRGQPRIVALAAARAAYAPRKTGKKTKGLGDGSDSLDEAIREGGKWGRRYELRYDAVTSKGSRGNLKKPTLDPYNGPHKQTLEDYRIGCVCGNRETSQRLRRQWNLSQTDWDAVLLPVRFAFSDPSHTADGGAYESYKSGKDYKDQETFWSYSENDGPSDPQHLLARKVLPELTWVPIARDGVGGRQGGESWKQVFQEPNGMDDTDTYKLFKKRLIH